MTDPRLDELLQTWLGEKEQGRAPTPAELCRDCPELAHELARRIDVVKRIDELKDPVSDASPVLGSCSACGYELTKGCRFCPACGGAVATPSGETTGAYQPELRVPPSAAMKDGRFAPGQVLAGRYRVVSRLGKGGMGEVYRADDLRLGQSVALKFLTEGFLNDPKRVALLHEEVKLSRQISHPNVCRVYDIAEADGQTFLSMEFIDGEDLASLLRRIGRLPPDKGVDIARQLCLGLAAAHDKGVIHRDLKPANVMLDGRGQVRITDFGLARLTDKVTGTEVRSGTPVYMAPEQLAGKEVTHRSDIYSLGLILYEIFTGKKAFQASSLAELAGLHEGPPPTPSSHIADVDPTVERVILGCLEPDPRSRMSSALAVAVALPGGDPLAAAQAAGDTPSPEMVAAAGGEGSLTPMAGLLLFAGILTCLVFFAFVTKAGSAQIWTVAIKKPPDVLVYRAEELLKRLGHDTNQAFDRAYGWGGRSNVS
jgi:serine/threonine-protein kinase